MAVDYNLLKIFSLTIVFTVIEFGIAGLAAISVAGLAFMHTWLIATMQTTNEDVSVEENSGIQ